MTREQSPAYLEVMARLKAAQECMDADLDADKALCDFLWKLGYGDVVEEWEKVDKWYA